MLLTAEQIAEQIGVSIRAVTKKKEIEKFFAGYAPNPQGTGRPVKTYHLEALQLWGVQTPTPTPTKNTRKQRSDLGKPRKPIKNELQLKELIRQEYLSTAENDIQAACERICRQQWQQHYSDTFPNWRKLHKYFYHKRLMRNDHIYKGYAIAENWRRQWQLRWKRKDTALIKLPTNRYDYIKLFTEMGLIAPGTGAAHFIIFDDHTSDSFMHKQQPGYPGQLPKGLYAIDLISGMPLDFEPGEVTTTIAGLMLLRISLRYGLPKLTIMENSRAMKSQRMQGLIQALYPQEILDQYNDPQQNNWFKQIFPQFNSPIERNIPLIPRYPGKARIERWFRSAILRHDAKYFPQTYHGGGKNPVQLTLNTNPAKPPESYTLQNYYQSLQHWLWQEFPDTEHPAMFPGFQRQTGLTPTIRNVWKYYGGDNPGTHWQPDKTNIAQLLYWLAEDKESATHLRKTTVKATSGRVQCTINHQPCWFVDPTLLDLEGQRIAIITIPNQIAVELHNKQLPQQREVNYAALFHIHKGQPQFLNICRNIYIDHPEVIQEAKQTVRHTRQQYKKTTNTGACRSTGACPSETKETLGLPQMTKQEALELPPMTKQETKNEVTDPEIQKLIDL